VKSTLLKSLLCLLAVLPQAAERSVPVAEEPRHRVVFSNEYVLVIDAVVPPGDATLYHTHSEDNVPVAISGGRMRTEVLGGAASESDVPTGGVWFARASYTHKITNVGRTPLRFIDAEILRSPGGPADAKPLDAAPGTKLEIENERARVYRMTLAPGQSTGRHVHALAGLSVAVTAGKVAITSDGKGREVVEVKAGEFAWRGSAGAHSVENVGDAPFEAIEIDWK
jgi:quercetin dioxygenase-like cupin family protein